MIYVKLNNSRIAVAYRVAEPRRIPYLNFSFYEGSILSHFFFHFAALPNQQIDRMIPYMRDHFGPRMFFAGNNYEWPRGSIDAAKRSLEQAGGQVVGEEYYPIGVSDGDIERLLDHVAQSVADVFVPYFAGADQIHLLTRFAARGLKNRMAVVMGHYDEAMASRLSAEVREGYYSSNTYFMTLETPENKEYLARLSSLPGVDGIYPQGNGILTSFGEGAYLCVKSFAMAANKAGNLDPEALIKALETITVSGPQGDVQIDPETHHAQVNTCLSRCEADGSFTIIEKFGTIPAVLPERYRYLRISKRPSQKDIYLQSRMMEQITEAVLLVHATDDTIVYTNPGAERMFGYASGELADKRFSVLLAPSGKLQEESIASICEALSRKGMWQGETENIASDGRRFWCSASISAFTHPEYGEVWMILYKDITERKLAEAALQKSKDLLQSIVENAPIRVFWKNCDSRYLGCNTRFAKDAGRSSPGELTGKTDFDMGWKDQACLYRADDKAVMESGNPKLGYEEPQTTPDGNNIWLRTSKVPLRDESNQVIGILGIYEDITERKQAEAAIEHANRALATLSAVNRNLVHATDENELLQAICQAIVWQKGYRMAWVGYKQHDESKSIKIMAHAGHDEGYLDTTQISWAENERGMGPTGRAIRSMQTQVCRDIANDPAFLPWRDAALQRGYRSSIALPLADGEAIGALMVYADEPNAFDDSETALLEDMAGDLAFGVYSLHTRHERDLALEQNRRQLVQLEYSLEDTVRAVATIVEMRDPYTAGHQVRVADLATAIAKQMGLPEEQIHAIHLAGVLHDLGKIKIPAEILSKPGRITDIEFGLIKVHPQAGYDILKGISFPWPIALMVLQHHERLDGSGYPQGLKGDAILLEARIINVADVVEAISAHRPYRPGLGIDVALAEITKNRGKLYDPQVVDACLAVFRDQHYSFKN